LWHKADTPRRSVICPLSARSGRASANGSAKALGLDVPVSVLVSANEAIE
jgi:hypothetical protein